MAVSTTVCRSQYTVSGAITNPLAIGFLYQLPADILVLKYVAAAPLVLILNSDYTLDGSNNVVPIAAGPGNVILGDKLTILRTMSFTQLLDLTTNGLNSVANIGAALDKLTQIVQQIQDIQTRCLQLEPNDAAATPFSVTARISKNIGFDSSGNLILH
jgi:hypothetical protein